MAKMIETWLNDRWPLLLPEHRAARPEWYYWEAGRLASMWHHLGHSTPMHVSTDLGGRAIMQVPDLEPREVVYDIGAEEGDFPALFSSWGCDVVLFEPNDRVWPNIKAIWEANQLRPPLAVVPAFVGAEPRGDVLVSTWEPGGIAGWPDWADGDVIHDHGFKTMPEYPEIPVVTIDEMVNAFDTPPPTALTLDVEGAEYEVLLGARSVLQEHKPKVWVSIHDEFASEQYGRGNVYGDIRRLFADCGYPDDGRGVFIASDHEEHWQWLP